MREQMADSDVIVTIAPFRDVLLYLIVQRQLAALGCQQNTHRGKRLRDGCDCKNSLRRVGNVELEVRHPVTALVDDGPVAADADGTAWRVLRVPCVE